MRTLGLVTKSLIITLGLYAVTILIVAGFVAWGIDKTLTTEFQSRGKAIAESIVGGSVEILLNEDPATLQAMIDQQKDSSPGIAYILVVDEKGDVISHTFVPTVPDDIRGLPGDPHHTMIRRMRVADLGDCIDVCSPILAGQGGYVHVGMDRGPIAIAIWRRIQEMSGVLLLLFIVSALATVMLMRRVAKPLRLLTESAQRLASGETRAAGKKGVLPRRPRQNLPLLSRRI